MDKKELIDSLKKEGFSSIVIKAFEKVPRERFISKDFQKYAYDDIALPLEKGATISQPWTIAFMLNLLELNDGKMKVLEIGSGCGYVLALLDEITNGDIFGVEIIKKLAVKSKGILNQLKHDKIKVFCRNGYFGLKEKAPFDRILISASSDKIPEHLFGQLKDRGIIVVPVGDSIFKIKENSDNYSTNSQNSLMDNSEKQILINRIIHKKVEKKYEIKEFPGFVFVPLRKD